MHVQAQQWTACSSNQQAVVLGYLPFLAAVCRKEPLFTLQTPKPLPAAAFHPFLPTA